MAKKKDNNEVEELTPADKKKRIVEALDTLKEFSPIASFLDSAASNVENYDDTGCYILNALLSGKLRGGFPEGRMSLLAAESSTGKTYIALQAAAKAQKEGKTIVIFDSEYAIDKQFAKNLGLKTEEIMYFPIKTVEQCKNALYKFLSKVNEAGLIGQFFIIIDSIGAMISEMDYKRMEKESTSNDMGSAAKSMKALIKAAINLSGQTNTTIICTNHVYDNPNALYPTLEKPMPGGKCVRFLPTTILQLSATKVKSEDKERKIAEKAVGGSHGEVGIDIKGISIKNRICKPFVQGNMYLSFKDGLSKYYGLMDLAVELGALTNKVGRLYDENENFIGFSKDIQCNGEFWEGFIDKLQVYVDNAWGYRYNSSDDVPNDAPNVDIERINNMLDAYYEES